MKKNPRWDQKKLTDRRTDRWIDRQSRLKRVASHDYMKQQMRQEVTRIQSVDCTRLRVELETRYRSEFIAYREKSIP